MPATHTKVIERMKSSMGKNNSIKPISRLAKDLISSESVYLTAEVIRVMVMSQANYSEPESLALASEPPDRFRKSRRAVELASSDS
jgi:hypothetical protein